MSDSDDKKIKRPTDREGHQENSRKKIVFANEEIVEPVENTGVAEPPRARLVPIPPEKKKEG